MALGTGVSLSVGMTEAPSPLPARRSLCDTVRNRIRLTARSLPVSDQLAALAGQSLLFRFLGPALQSADADAFRRIRPAGVLLFADNLTSRTQIRELTDQLQALAREEGLPPLFIAADQEGGIVTRFPADMVTTPSAMALGALPEADIRTAARITAHQLMAVGINTNYAPVADINVNPRNPVIRTRAFGETPPTVARAVTASIAGHLDERCLPTVKHFPGHGDTTVDSHHGLPVIERDIAGLHATELVPFRAAIAADVPAIMTAHIVFPALDMLPATLSRRILTGLLREELGFDGLIHTDSMSMQAILDHWGLEEAIVMAKAAGVDIMESSEGPELLLRRHAALVQALADGRLAAELFTATIRRSDAARARFGIGDVPPATEGDASLAAQAEALARRTIRTEDGRAVPSVPDDPSTVIVAFARLRNLEVVDRLALPQVMEAAIAEALPAARMHTLPAGLPEPEVRAALTDVASATMLVIATRDAIEHEDQRAMAAQLMDAAPDHAEVIHVCLRGPYDAGLLGPRVGATVLTFGDAAVSLRALAEALAGR